MDARKLFQEARRDPKAGLEGADDRREEGRQVHATLSSRFPYLSGLTRP
jgi:hypothetical protein